MSTHYTSNRSMSRWFHFFGNVFIPICLVMVTGVAWSDGSRALAFPLTLLTDFYIVLCLIMWLARGRVVEKWLRVMAMQALVYSIYLAYIGRTDPAVLVSLELMGMLCFVASFAAEHHRRLVGVEAPSTNGRATEFPGIYRITCRPNGMQYIGMSSRPIKVRWHDHLSNLNAKRHHNDRLQHDWNTFRPEQFKWEVLEVVTDPVWLLDRERAWQNQDYDTTKRYNPPNLPPRIVKARSRPPMKRKART